MKSNDTPSKIDLKQDIKKSRPTIDGVRVRPLRAIPDERGRLMEILRSDWPEYQKFGQCYLTAAYPGVVKAWHYHKNQYDNFVCISGMMKLVIYDDRADSKTRGVVNEFFVGTHNLQLIQIPPLVHHGFKCISEHEALVINIPTQLFNYAEPDEYRIPPHTKDIPYDWSRKDG
ncbi:MAG TPA: dTDP-4-dehydrorhamnose 3,5-epimerase family protein [Elusimicrobiota bacterium]|nr:dTDP-4-dehydrorhamnose 3,5-epimerase family protein [Elusimicrobiota bacterium]